MVFYLVYLTNFEMRICESWLVVHFCPGQLTHQRFCKLVEHHALSPIRNRNDYNNLILCHYHNKIHYERTLGVSVQLIKKCF